MRAVRILRSQAGFTYLMAMMVVVVMGIMLAKVGQSWQMIMQREKEEELLFRGCQIRDAINRWHKPAGTGQQVATPLDDLKHLLQDPRTAGTVRHLRRLYNDPVTGKEWTLIRDPARGIIGVCSSSEGKPIKQDNFPDELKSFVNRKKYSEWQFTYQATASSMTGSTTNTGGNGTANPKAVNPHD